MLNKLIELTNEHPLIGGAISVTLAGLVTFWIKDIPKKIMGFFKRTFVTELMLTSANRSFHDLLKWIGENYRQKNFRKIKITNGLWGGSAKHIVSIGYGVHCIKYEGRFLLVRLSKEEGNQSIYDKEAVRITKIGRSKKIFDKLLHEVSSQNIDDSIIKIYKMDDSWNFVREQQTRAMESVFIEEQAKKHLITELDSFVSREDWYLKNGIPYQMGILLYGAPGTGKTSLVKAIASYLKYPIYYISPSSLSKLEQAMATLPKESMVVIEDIDSSYITKNRSKNSEDSQQKNNSTSAMSIISDMTRAGLSELLNALDGMFSAHGRILVATTNHIEKLDPAIIRPGRIDIKLEVGYVNKEILKLFMNRFYKDSTIDIDCIDLKDNITVSWLQSLMLLKKTDQEIIEACIKKGEKNEIKQII